MRNFMIALLLGIIIGATGFWYLQQERGAAMLREAKEAASKGQQAVTGAAADVKQAVAAKLEALELRAQDIREELERGGKVVRRKARDVGETVADAAADTAITAGIKAKLALDPDLSAAAITVNTTDGRVTLAGTVSSPEAIGKAVLLALETRGVREVVSTLQVKA
jgi:osmotically-inducible protein OsmY